MVGKKAKVLHRPGKNARDTQIAVIEVGESKTKYHIHRPLLEQHSEYFQKALNGPWKESRENLVALEDVDCDAFDIFVDWLYTQRLEENCEQWSGLKQDFTDVQINALKVYILADRILAPGFLRAAEKALRSILVNYEEPIAYKAIEFAFANLPADSDILEILVDIHCIYYSPSRWDEDDTARSKLPQEFLLRVMDRLCSSRFDRKKPWSLCDYHKHESEEEMDACEMKDPADIREFPSLNDEDN